MSTTANTTLLAQVTAIMADVAVDVPGVVTAFGRRAVAEHSAPPMVGWWPKGPEAFGGAKKSSFPGKRRPLYTSALTLSVRCWGVDLDAAMLLRESVIACIHRQWPGSYQLAPAVWVDAASQTDLGEMVDLTVTLDLAILDRAPLRATITSTSFTTAASPTGDGVLQPGETT